MHEEKLKNLFISELKDMYNAEQQIVHALPEVIQAVEAADLKKALEKHLKETKGQIERLKKVFAIVKIAPAGENCEAMEGLIRECGESLHQHEISPVRDAAIIAKCQRIEHYEISVYGTLRTFAKELGLDEAVDLLQENLDEEANADKTLTKIAEGGFVTSGINRKANK